MAQKTPFASVMAKSTNIKKNIQGINEHPFFIMHQSDKHIFVLIHYQSGHDVFF